MPLCDSDQYLAYKCVIYLPCVGWTCRLIQQRAHRYNIRRQAMVAKSLSDYFTCPELVQDIASAIQETASLCSTDLFRMRNQTCKPRGYMCRNKREVDLQNRVDLLHWSLYLYHPSVTHHHFCREYFPICTIHSLLMCRPLHVTFLLLISIDYWAFRVDRSQMYLYKRA